MGEYGYRRRVVSCAGCLKETFFDWSDERHNDQKILGLVIGVSIGTFLHFGGVIL